MAYSVKLTIICSSLLILSYVSLSAAKVVHDDDCKNMTLSGPSGELNFTTTISITCYRFQIFDVTGKAVYFDIDPASLDSVIVYTSDSAGGDMIKVSEHNYNKSSVFEPYLVVANASANESLIEVLRVEINTRVQNGTNITAGSYTNTSCVRALEDPFPTVITPPDYLHGSDLNISCLYTFSLEGAADTTSSYLFTQFNVSAPSSISFESPAGKIIEKYSGSNLPIDLIIGNNSMLTMNINMANKFSLKATHTTTSHACTGYKLVGNNSITITSPDYPKPYANNLHCKYIITATDPSRYVHMTAVDVTLAPDYDMISITDGGSSSYVGDKNIAVISNSNLEEHADSVYLSSGPAVTFRFVSGPLGNAKGFSFNVTTEAISRMYLVPDTISYAPNGSDPNSAKFTLLTQYHNKIEISPNTTGGVQMSPDSTVKCYDGDSEHDTLIAVYRTDLIMYPAFSTQHRVLCIAENFNTNTDMFSATTSASSAEKNGYDKYSFGSSDVYSGQLPIVSAANQSYNWIIQPSGGFNQTVIELVVDQLSKPLPANTTVEVYNLKGILLASITSDVVLPFVMRTYAVYGARLSVTSSALNGSTSLTTLSLSGSYSLDDIQANITEKSGMVMSPHYPLRTPQDTKKEWLFTLEADKSLSLSFSSMFELSNKSYLQVTGSNHTYLNLTGPMTKSPADLVLNNTSVNESRVMTVTLVTYSQTLSTGVKLNYTYLDGGFNSAVNPGGLEVRTPGYPEKLNTSFSGVWVLSVDKNDTKGNLQQVNAQVTFTPNNATKLEFRDGSSSTSPLITHNVSRSLMSDKYTVSSSSNYIYISYTYTEPEHAVNKSYELGNPISLMLTSQGCSSGYQCLSAAANQTVCVPAVWRCDKMYHCIDGQDELNCGAAPTTKAPAVTKEGAQWWVVALCILAGFVLGIIITTIIITSIMRRRGAGYNRLSELMTPVPT